MTRKGEIVKASVCQYQIIGTMEEQQAFKNGFVKGAEWADRTMIEKAWDWFYNMALDYMSGDITDVKWGSMKEDFFKVMEE